MNEYIDVVFRTPDGRRLKVRRQTSGGIEFDERDPIERTVGLQLTGRSEATRERMRRIARVKGWDVGQFKLNVSAEDGSLVLRGTDADALPEGLYALRVQVEEARTSQQKTAVDVDQDGHGALDVVVSEDAREVVVDLDDCDAEIRRVLDASTIDGEPGEDWLESDEWRAARKACLLNVLASLRSQPLVSDPLVDLAQAVFAVYNDRAYMRFGAGLLPALEALAGDEKQLVYREGEPHAPIHQRLLNQMPEPPDVKARFKGLLSYRAEAKGGPSLQLVVAVPPTGLAYTYADVDLDLGNPLQDALGFVVHMGELLSGKQTNHLDLRKRLAKTKAGRFLAYTIRTV